MIFLALRKCEDASVAKLGLTFNVIETRRKALRRSLTNELLTSPGRWRRILHRIIHGGNRWMLGVHLR